MKVIIIFLICFSSGIFSQWNIQNSGATGNLSDVFFVNQNTGYVSNIRNLLKTTNGGANWSVIRTFQPLYVINSVYFINGDTGWVAGVFNFEPPFGFIEVTYNGGVSWWTQQTLGITSRYDEIRFVNSLTGYAFGTTNTTVMPPAQARSLFSKTTNGGALWIHLNPLGNDRWIINSNFINENTGWICANGYVYKTTNAGDNWTLPSGIQFPNLKSVYFVNVNTGWIAGSDIFKTTNGGASWVNQNAGTGPHTSIVFTTETFGWVTGLAGVIKYTASAGSSWVNIGGVTGSNLNAVFFINFNSGWICGDNGVILHTTNNAGISGFVQSGNSIPDEFSLSQNYPNPFNPQTKIRFQIARLADVKLIVYDLLGREVTTLVNEELKPGTYEADWDASGFSSGIYFYRLISNEFSKTRKMVLMK